MAWPIELGATGSQRAARARFPRRGAAILVSEIDQLQAARWFAGKSRAIRDTRVLDRAVWAHNASLRLVEVHYVDGLSETYVLVDRIDDPAVARQILEKLAGASITTERGGRLEFRPTHLLAAVDRTRIEPIAPMRGEQSNTSIRFGNVLIMKLFRRLQFGPNPDVEVGWFLTEHSQFRGTPPVFGSVEYQSPGGDSASLALLQRFEANRGDAWTSTLERLRRVLSGEDMTESVASMARLGETTADLHLALASGQDDFAAEPITTHDVEVWERAVIQEIEVAAHALAERQIDVNVPTLLHRADGIARLRGALKARHHGDYHLGQVLVREDGSFVIIDFEGEPSRPLALRREKRSPLRDVAGMLRSFDYARNTALRVASPPDPRSVRVAAEWYTRVREVFLGAYLRTVRGTMPDLLPDDVDTPLAAMELEKAAYEVLYELNMRPDWLPIPLAALSSS